MRDPEILLKWTEARWQMLWVDSATSSASQTTLPLEVPCDPVLANAIVNASLPV